MQKACNTLLLQHVRELFISDRSARASCKSSKQLLLLSIVLQLHKTCQSTCHTSDYSSRELLSWHVHGLQLTNHCARTSCDCAFKSVLLFHVPELHIVDDCSRASCRHHEFVMLCMHVQRMHKPSQCSIPASFCRKHFIQRNVLWLHKS